MPTSSLTRLAALLDADPALAARFAPPLAEDEVARCAQAIGVALPAEFLALYRLCDGNARPRWDDATEALVGDEETLWPDSTLRLSSLEEVLSSKRSWDELAHEFSGLPAAQQREKSRLAFWHPAWVPFMENEAEVYALATEPCFGGPRHQVVWFDFKGHDCWEVAAASFEAWLHTIVETFAAGSNDLDDDLRRTLNPGWRFIELVAGEASPERFARPGRPR